MDIISISSHMVMCIYYHCLMSLLLSYSPVMAQELEEEIGTINAYIGDTVTLRCNLKNLYVSDFVIWYHATDDLYISYDDTLLLEVPSELSERISVVCQPSQGLCSLTIRDVRFSDNGTYQCGYGYTSGAATHLTTRFLTTGQLIVTNGHPPSRESPICNTFILDDGEFLLPKVNPTVGDAVYLYCSVTGASTKASLSWLRDDVPISVAERGFYTSYQLELTDDDAGVVYTCLMSHPTLNETKSCALIPVPAPSTTAASNPVSAVSTLEIHDAYPVSSSMSSAEESGHNSSPVNLLYIIIPVIIIVFFVFAVICLIMWRRKRNKMSAIPNKKPDYELTYDRDCSITAYYAAVNAPDSIDKALELRPVPATTTEQDPFLQQNAVSTEGQGTFPVYAKPDKTKRTRIMYHHSPAATATSSDDCPEYENLPPVVNQESSEEDDDDGQGGLMYAELDLPVVSSASNSARLHNNVNVDVTIYAHIEGTL